MHIYTFICILYIYIYYLLYTYISVYTLYSLHILYYIYMQTCICINPAFKRSPRSRPWTLSFRGPSSATRLLRSKKMCHLDHAKEMRVSMVYESHVIWTGYRCVASLEQWFFVVFLFPCSDDEFHWPVMGDFESQKLLIATCSHGRQPLHLW